MTEWLNFGNRAKLLRSMAHLATTEFLTHIKSLFPGGRSVLQSPWYLVASVAFSASNRPEAVPAVFHFALNELKLEQAGSVEGEEAQKEQLKLARRSRDCLVQSGLLCGYSRVSNTQSFVDDWGY